jgi:alpha-tubulin suppressor-like RCC1 family protein
VLNPTAPIGATIGKSFVSISAGRTHSLAADINGTLYAWGSQTAEGADTGWLGINTTTATSFTPVIISTANMGQFISVAAGRCHSLALTRDGSIFTVIILHY